jgi:hypothetical protein
MTKDVNYDELPLNFRVASEQTLSKRIGNSHEGHNNQDLEEYYKALSQSNDSQSGSFNIQAERQAIAKTAYPLWEKHDTSEVIEIMGLGDSAKPKTNAINPDKILAGRGQAYNQR